MIHYNDVSRRNPARGAELRIDEIVIPATTRPCNATAVVELKRSIEEIGLQSAPSVVERDGVFVLVAGRHRLEALKMLHHETVRVRVVDFDDIEARMWTISENLHRAELPAWQRDEQIAEWIKLTEERREAEGAQIAQKVGRPESGNSLAARELGISRDEIRRARIIAGLPVETKQAAHDLGLDDNRSAGLRAAREPTPEAQIEVLHHIVGRGRVTEEPPPVESPDDYGEDSTPSAPRVARRVRDPWETVIPAKITRGHIVSWCAGTTDTDRGFVADLTFQTSSAAEKFRHIVFAFKALATEDKLKFDEVVQAWLAQHEQEARA